MGVVRPYFSQITPATKRSLTPAGGAPEITPLSGGTTKHSQITPASVAPAPTDQIVGVVGGTSDRLYTLSQVGAAIGGGGGGGGANPTATASDTVVNGSALTFMRSDAAPAVQKTSSSQFGLCKVDGSSITAAGGIISSTGGGAGGANPSATAGPTAINGSAATFMRSDAAPAIQKASASQFGLCQVDGTTITAVGGVISSSGGGGGGGSIMGQVSLFPTHLSASQAVMLPSTVNYLETAGYYSPEDGGDATYQRAGSIAPFNPGITISPIALASPGIQAGTSATTVLTNAIAAGQLAIVVVYTRTLPSGFGVTAVNDSAGNVYLPAVQSAVSASYEQSSIFYCANPNFVPSGGTVTITGTDPNFYSIYVYSVNGFSGAVLDQTASIQVPASPFEGGFSLSTGALAGSPSLAIGTAHAEADDSNAIAFPSGFNPGAGWNTLAPATTNIHTNPTCFLVANSTAPVTFAPTWTLSANNAVGLIATFKTYPFSTVLPTSLWNYLPRFPLRMNQFGTKADGVTDISQQLVQLTQFLPAIVKPSRTFSGVTISIANPAVITISGHQIRCDQLVRFSTTGALPTGIVAGQLYYVQYGTVTANTFQISTTTTFLNPTGFLGLQAKGVPVATSGTQSGTHSLTVYGEEWFDIVVDPGLYAFATAKNGFISLGMGAGLQKLRVLGHGATITGEISFTAQIENVDPNTSSGKPDVVPFQTTLQGTVVGNSNTITLVNLSDAPKIRVNSWVRLQALETELAAAGNSNCYVFEYLQVESVNLGTGVVTFYDDLQYQYRSTYPSFTDSGGRTYGPASLMQIPDIWDQEVEIHGVTFTNATPQPVFGAVKSMRLVDCVAINSAISTVDIKTFIMERCRWIDCDMEVDKQIDLFFQKECIWDTGSSMRFQSASINKAIFERCRLHVVLGTPKNAIFLSTNIDALSIGPVLGITERIIIAFCTILEILPLAMQTQTLLSTNVAFSNGVIYLPVGFSNPPIYWPWLGPNTNSVNPIPWSVPGAKIMMTCPGLTSSSDNLIGATISGMGSPFTILDVYVGGAGGNSYCCDTTLTSFPTATFTFTASVSGTSMIVTAINPANALLLYGTVISGGGIVAGTTITSGPHPSFPNATNNLGTFTLSTTQPTIASTTLTATIPMQFLPNPCPRMTVIGSTGCATLTDMSGGPPDIPLWSYFKRSYYGFYNSPSGNYANVRIMGNLLTWTINVTKPYTGAAATMNLTVCMFGYQNIANNLTPCYVLQTINLKTPGVRTITASGFSGNVAGDTLFAVPFWLSGGQAVEWSPASGGDTINQMAGFTMTAQTDQGTGAATTSVGNTISGFDILADSITGSINY